LLSVLGEVVSSKKEELDRILSAFNIQVDNPVSILNQDAARTFLNSTDPRDKYKLFMKATQLEQIEQLYKDSMSDKRWATAMVNSKKEVGDLHVYL
jgi:chromosome segregation ATPase